MAYDVELSVAAIDDLVSIFDFLVESYMEFGEDEAEALDRAGRRIDGIKASLKALGTAPKQGTLRPEIREGLRQVTKDRAVIYFDVDDQRARVQILAVFSGDQDHQRRMMINALAR